MLQETSSKRTTSSATAFISDNQSSNLLFRSTLTNASLLKDQSELELQSELVCSGLHRWEKDDLLDGV